MGNSMICISISTQLCHLDLWLPQVPRGGVETAPESLAWAVNFFSLQVICVSSSQYPLAKPLQGQTNWEEAGTMSICAWRKWSIESEWPWKSPLFQ